MSDQPDYTFASIVSALPPELAEAVRSAPTAEKLEKVCAALAAVTLPVEDRQVSGAFYVGFHLGVAAARLMMQEALPLQLAKVDRKNEDPFAKTLDLYRRRLEKEKPDA